MLDGDDWFAEDVDEDTPSSVPGPLPQALQAIWGDFMTKMEAFVQEFAKKSRKLPSVLWKWIGEVFKLTREPNLFNMWVQRWALLNAKEEGGMFLSRVLARHMLIAR